MIASMDSLQLSYEATPYPANAYFLSHPDQLASVARWHGIETAPVFSCRVLELGCGAGGNLIPMAEVLPDSRFLGIDFSRRQTADGNAVAARLKLSNVELRCQNLLETSDLGSFDYIIAHGLYSWVAQEVRDRVLQICRDHLAENGIAYISYSTLPGGHFRNSVRDVMRYHTRRIEDPQRRVGEARAILGFLSRALPNGNSYGMAFREEAARFEKLPDACLLHDQLGDINEPCYFYEFVDHASRFGLQYLADAEPRLIMGNALPEELRNSLPPRSDFLMREQYLDFYWGGAFRRSLLCRERLSFCRNPTPDSLRGFYISSNLKPVKAVESQALLPEAFEGPPGQHITSTSPLARALLVYLADLSPDRILLEDLVDRCVSLASMLAPPPPVDVPSLLAFLLQLFYRNAIELHTRPADFTTVPGPRPRVRPLARLPYWGGDFTINLLHQRINLDATMAAFLPFLDGAHDRDQLHVEWQRLTQLRSTREKGPPSTAVDFDAALNHIARAALLMK
jgi:SAM-dependent methyltransferase